MKSYFDLTEEEKNDFGYPELTTEMFDKIKPFIEWSEKNVKKFLWSEAHCYSEKLWCGGISDFGCILNDGRICLGDFKSSKEAYSSHWLQGAGYVMQIEENGLFDKDGNSLGNVLKSKSYRKDCPEIEFDMYTPIYNLIIVPFGAEKVEPVFNPLPIEEYKKGFEASVVLYRLLGLEKKED